MPSINEVTYSTPKQPRQLRLDTIARCNASCSSCHRFLTNRQGEMSLMLIDEILNDVRQWPEPLTEIVPVNYGEFSLRKDWIAILMAISQKLPHTQIVLPTNGSLLDDQKTILLSKIQTLRVVNFSVNAYFDETYKNFMGLPPENIAKVRRAVAQLRVLRPDITRWVSMVFDPAYSTDFERDAFIEYWRPYAYPQILPAASAGRPAKKPIYPVQLPCRSIFSDIVVGFDRKISSCCFDPAFSIDLGTYEGDLLTSWRNAKLEQLRRLHNERLRKEVAICRSCTFA